jgi:hypothetical protein
VGCEEVEDAGGSGFSDYFFEGDFYFEEFGSSEYHQN